MAGNNIRNCYTIEQAHRLDSISPNLGAIFVNATLDIQRQALLTACDIAIETSGLKGKEVEFALNAIHSGYFNLPMQSKWFKDLSHVLDETYLILTEEYENASSVNESTKSKSLDYFARARAASALAFVLSGDDSQLHEALYEAISSTSDSSDIIRQVKEILGSDI